MPLAIIGAGVSAAGSVLGGVMAQQQANYTAKAADANAAAANQQAYAQAGAVRDQYGEVAATQRAQLAASGVDINSVTAGTLALETQKRAEQAAATQIWQGHSEATAYKNQAAVAKAEGKAALVGGIIGGVGSILGGVANMAGTSGVGGGTPPAAPSPLSLGSSAPPVVGLPQTYTGPKRLIPLYPGGIRYPGGRMTF
jgi:hypothetical protein